MKARETTATHLSLRNPKPYPLRSPHDRYLGTCHAPDLGHLPPTCHAPQAFVCPAGYTTAAAPWRLPGGVGTEEALRRISARDMRYHAVLPELHRNHGDVALSAEELAAGFFPVKLLLPVSGQCCQKGLKGGTADLGLVSRVNKHGVSRGYVLRTWRPNTSSIAARRVMTTYKAPRLPLLAVLFPGWGPAGCPSCSPCWRRTTCSTVSPPSRWVAYARRPS